MNQPLGRRLRYAAIDRTLTDAERVDDFILDADRVIDLREFDKDPSGASIADPAKALRSLRGRLGDAAEVSNLHDESELPKQRWRLGLRARHTFGDIVDSVPTPAATATATIVEAQMETTRPAPRFRRCRSRWRWHRRSSISQSPTTNLTSRTRPTLASTKPERTSRRSNSTKSHKPRNVRSAQRSGSAISSTGSAKSSS